MNPHCRRSWKFSLFFLCVCLAGQVAFGGDAPPVTDDAQQIAKVLQTQRAAWNAGDIPGFMEGYAKLPTLRFASGGNVTYGWQETLQRYQAHYPDHAAMGTLTFTDLDTTLLSPEAALVFGRWRLKTDKGEPNGLFTLLFRKREGRWYIVADHTSAATP